MDVPALSVNNAIVVTALSQVFVGTIGQSLDLTEALLTFSVLPKHR